MKMNNLLQSILFNWPAKIICIVLAGLLFFFVQNINLDVRDIETTLEVKLPQGYETSDNYVKTVTVSVRGPKETIYMIQSDSVNVVADFTYVKEPGIYTAAVKVLRSDSLDTDVPLEVSTSPDRISIRIEAKDDGESKVDNADELQAKGTDT